MNVTNKKLEIPPIGFGTWKLEGISGEKSIEDAVELGYRHIDTAQMYANEALVGNVLKRISIQRKDIFITTKLHNEIRGYYETIEAIQRSMELLQVDYIDLVLLHWPKPRKYKDDWVRLNIKSWRALEHLYNEGLVRGLGVSNFLKHHLEALTSGITIQPMVNQIEYHPYFIQEDIRDYCINKNIVLEAWSTLANGRCLDSPILTNIASYYGKSVAQICISYVTKKGLLPIIKASSYEHIKDCIEGLELEISDEHVCLIDELENTIRIGRHPDDE